MKTNEPKPNAPRPNARQILWSVVTWALFWAIYGLLRGGIGLLAGVVVDPMQIVFTTLSGALAGAFFGAIFGFFGITGDRPAIDLLLPKLPGVILGGIAVGLAAHALKLTALTGPAIVVGMFLGAWLWDKTFPSRRPAETHPAEQPQKQEKKK